MRNIIKFIIGIGLVSSFGAYQLISNLSFELEKQAPLFESEENRRSVTFLLGEDKGEHQYFRLAEEHFLFDEEEKTDVVVSSCRSLEDMFLYLNNNQQEKQWGTIQVVLHGNPWQGLSLPIINDGPRATKRELVKALLKNPLPAIETTAIDSSTKINFWGCGIGKNPFINMAMDSFFRLKDGSIPDIYTSPHFVVFKEVGSDIAPKRIKASYWPYIFKRGYRPSEALISQELSKQHPDVKINWNEAVSRSTETTADTYQNSFHLPVSWTVTYPTKEARPEVNTMSEKLAWVKAQPDLMAQIEELGIPLEKYTWTVSKRLVTQDDGSKVPVIKGIGMATVLYVLKEEVY